MRRALSIRIDPTEHGPRIVFAGGPGGEHSLDLGSSTPERARAHARGYAENADFDRLGAEHYASLAADRVTEWHARRRAA